MKAHLNLHIRKHTFDGVSVIRSWMTVTSKISLELQILLLIMVTIITALLPCSFSFFNYNEIKGVKDWNAADAVNVMLSLMVGSKFLQETRRLLLQV